MKLNAKRFFGLLAVAAALISTRSLSAQVAEEPRPEAGTSANTDAPDLAQDAAAVIVKPSAVFAASNYATGGVSLRNRGAGNINVSGLGGLPKITFIYWAVINNGVPPVAARSIQVQRLFPAPASAVVVLPGVVVGAGPSPCWGPAGKTIITVYRAVVPVAIASGNGSYQVTLLPGAQLVTNGASPWTAFGLPSWEGASMVMIGAGVNTVSLYDVGLAGRTFEPSPAFNYTLALPLATKAAGVLWDNIGADGQHGGSAARVAAAPVSDETTTINGFPVAGAGSMYLDRDWNGSAGLPATQLWDDTGHDITGAAPAGTVKLNVVINSVLLPVDCLTPVANVVQE